MSLRKASILLPFLFSFFKIIGQCSFSLGSDINICPGDPVNQVINGPAGYSSYQWNNGSTAASITATAPGIYACTAIQYSNNLVTNGNFSSGSTGISTSYVVGTGGPSGQLTNPGTYAVTTNPKNVHNNFPVFGDHTTGTGGMMVVNGASTANVSVWCQTITVTPNTTYDFSAWIATCAAWDASELAKLQFSINGVLLGSVFSPPLTTGQWTQFSATWNSGTNTSANICIQNQNTAAGGNDFAMDDISFRKKCTFTDTLIIKEIPLPVITAASPLLITCTSSTVTLQANSSVTGSSFQWAGPGAFSANSATASTSVAGTYTVTVKEPVNNCAAKATVVVDVDANIPNVAVGVTGTLNCKTENVSLTGNSTTTGVSFSWSGPHNFSSTEQSPEVTEPGYYVLTVTDNTSGCARKDSVLVAIDTVKPIISTPGAVKITCQKPSVIVAVNSSVSNSVYNWTGPSGFTSTNQQETVSVPGNYKVEVSSATNGCTTSLTQEVGIDTVSPIIALQTPPTITCKNLQVNLAVASSAANSSYSWSGPQSFTAAVQNPTTSAAGTYTVSVKNEENGCVKTATVTVLLDTVKPVVMAGADAVIPCSQPQINLNATSSLQNAAYEWSGPNSFLAATAGIQVTEEGTYIVKITDLGNLCTGVDTIQVSKTPSPVANIAVVNATCFGASNGNLNVSVNWGLAPFTYLWSNSAAVTGSINNSLSAGNYTCTVTDANGCSVKVNAAISQPAKILIAPIPEDTVCAGSPVNLVTAASGGNPPYNFFWFNQSLNLITSPVTPTSSEKYGVVVLDVNGCVSDTMTFKINVYPSLQITAIPPVGVCKGNSATLQAVVSGGHGSYQFEWLPSGFTTSQILVTPAINTTYTLMVEDACESKQLTIPVDVFPLPDAPIQLADTGGCATFCTEIATTSLTGYTYLWKIDNTVISTANLFHHCFEEGVYQTALFVKDDKGCENGSTKTIHAYPHPKARFSVPATEFNILDPVVDFENFSVDAVSYKWNFGNIPGNSSSSINPSVMFPATEACYDVQLTVKNKYECLDTIVQKVCIQDVYTVYFPNTFTPNNDGLNDEFVPKGTGYQEDEFYLAIYDRWGNKVFESNTFNKGWNGALTNRMQAMQDVYVWISRVKDQRGKLHEYGGRLSLVR